MSALAWGWGLGAGLVFGLALSVASTGVLLRALEERRLLDSDKGRIAVGWLIVEDLAMVLALVLLPALAVCIWLVAHGEAQFGTSTGETLLLIGSGPITAIPLILFAAGARMLKLSTIGILRRTRS